MINSAQEEDVIASLERRAAERFLTASDETGARHTHTHTHTHTRRGQGTHTHTHTHTHETKARHTHNTHTRDVGKAL